MSAVTGLVFCDRCRGSITPAAAAVRRGVWVLCPQCAEAIPATAAPCGLCGEPGAEALRPWNPLSTAEHKYACATCRETWLRPIDRWAARWVAGGLALAAGFLVVMVGVAGDEVYRVGRVMSPPWIVVGFATMLLGLALRPSYRRPPEPPWRSAGAGPRPAAE